MAQISVCMIVKNEENVLARCLDSLRGIYDEIIIADTGSTDSTKEIAARYTDKIYDFTWVNDFSAARNFVFSKATCEYIYSADADEVIDEENRCRFLALKDTLTPDIELVVMRYGNQLQFNTTYNFDLESRPKLFKRLRAFRWIEPIHEIVDLTVKTLESDIVILHMPTQLHAERDFSIFKRVLEAGRPLSARLLGMYARELFVSGSERDFSEALPYFESILHEESRSIEEVRAAQCVTARAARLTGNDAIFFKAALKNVIGVPSAEVCCELGEYYYAARDFEEAATWFYTAAYGGECELNIHSCGDWPLYGLAKSYRGLGNHAEADDYEKKAREWSPPNQTE